MVKLKIATAIAVLIVLAIAGAIMSCVSHYTLFEKVIGTIAVAMFLGTPIMIMWDIKNGKSNPLSK